jgi:hypothetical protein
MRTKFRSSNDFVRYFFKPTFYKPLRYFLEKEQNHYQFANNIDGIVAFSKIYVEHIDPAEYSTFNLKVTIKEIIYQVTIKKLSGMYEGYIIFILDPI